MKNIDFDELVYQEYKNNFSPNFQGEDIHLMNKIKKGKIDFFLLRTWLMERTQKLFNTIFGTLSLFGSLEDIKKITTLENLFQEFLVGEDLNNKDYLSFKQDYENQTDLNSLDNNIIIMLSNYMKKD